MSYEFSCVFSSRGRVLCCLRADLSTPPTGVRGPCINWVAHSQTAYARIVCGDKQAPTREMKQRASHIRPRRQHTQPHMNGCNRTGGPIHRYSGRGIHWELRWCKADSFIVLNEQTQGQQAGLSAHCGGDAGKLHVRAPEMAGAALCSRKESRSCQATGMSIPSCFCPWHPGRSSRETWRP